MCTVRMMSNLQIKVHAFLGTKSSVGDVGNQMMGLASAFGPVRASTWGTTSMSYVHLHANP
jgi:hypothetical protein